MSAAPEAKLVYMANQIATFFASQPQDDAVRGIETHIRSFWDPRMRAKILSFVAEGGDGLDPLAREALNRLAREIGYSQRVAAMRNLGS